MKFYPIHNPPIAYVAEEPEDLSYVADPPPGFIEGYDGVGYVADPYGAEAEVAYIADDPGDEVAYVADDPGDEMAYVAEDPYDEVGYFGQEEDDMADFAEEEEFAAADEDFYDEGAGDYGDEEEIEGYLPETREPAFSPRVMPVSRLEGYAPPKTINPTAEQIRPAEVVSRPASSWFKPLW